MAAFFARTKVKLPWNDSNGIEISSTDNGEHKMPGAKSEMAPTFYRGEVLDLGLPDLERREKLAYWMVLGDNPFFARAFVNHIQARHWQAAHQDARHQLRSARREVRVVQNR